MEWPESILATGGGAGKDVPPSSSGVSKLNTDLEWIQIIPVDRSDARNHGITEDRREKTRDGRLLSIMDYTDPQTSEQYEFLTNESDLPAGVIAQFYRRRWEPGKVFA